MFEVRVRSPFNEQWEQREERIVAAAGRKSSFGGTDFEFRDLGFTVKTFDEARAIKKRIDDAGEQATVTIRED